MEENVTRSMQEEIHQAFGDPQTDIRTYSPLSFAYIGDAVFDLIIRTLVVEKGQKSVNTLHKHTSKIVCAATQAALVEAIVEDMTPEEQDVYRRGKNTKIHSAAKNASLSDYRKATGLEAVCGYLYLAGNTARVVELIELGMNRLNLTI